MMRAIAWLLTTLSLIAVAIGAGALWVLSQLTVPGPLTELRTVQVEEGMGPRRLAPLLEEQGVVSSRWLFMVGVYAERAQADLKAGEYAFAPQMTVQDVIRHLRDGKPVTYNVTVPEGLTVRQIAAVLQGQELLTGEVGELPPEGSLLPDTYQFTRGDSRRDILQRMQRAHDTLLAELWPQRRAGLPLASPEEAVTLASIVEKETGVAAERPVVAGVFVNRLVSGIRLQSDPTTIYGLSGGSGSLGRALTRADWRDESPYNTYVIKGLPPGPIANPGRAALEAVLNPDNNDYLYFVADGTGGHKFARTLQEHNRNVAQWQRLRDAEAPPEGGNAGGAAPTATPAPPAVPAAPPRIQRPRMD